MCFPCCPGSPWVRARAFSLPGSRRRGLAQKAQVFSLTLLQRLLVAGRVIFFYAGKLLWPANLIFTYPRWQPDPRVWWQYLFPLGVLAMAIFLWRLPRRGPLAGFLIFCGTLFPVLGFLNVYPFIYSFVADHFQYLACLGIIVPLASALVVGASRISKSATAALLLIPAILGVLTWRQSRMYSDSDTLYRTTLARNPSSWMAHDNLGITLAQTPGHLSEAMAEFETAVRLNPDNAHAHVNLGNALSQVPGRLPQAIAEYHIALQIAPSYAEAHSDLGVALAQMPGRLSEAINEYRAALRINPRLAETHNYLGIAAVADAGPSGRRRSPNTRLRFSWIPITEKRITTWERRWADQEVALKLFPNFKQLYALRRTTPRRTTTWA